MSTMISPAKEPQVHLGLDEGLEKKIADHMCGLLGDSVMLYHILRNFHWNVTGPHFRSLHELFEEQYTEMVEGIDIVAERIRSLGYIAPGTMAEHIELASIKEPEGVPSDMDMVKQTLDAHETLIRNARKIFPICDEAGDEATADLVTERLRAHEKAAWMLRSFLG